MGRRAERRNEGRFEGGIKKEGIQECEKKKGMVKKRERW